MDLARIVALARGAEPADLLLTHARLVNVLSGEVYSTEVAVAGDRVVGLGPGYRARSTLDLRGRYLCPGFIDAHVHVESSHLTPREYAGAVVPRGVTTVVADPHEIASVTGLDGVAWLLRDAAAAPLDLFLTAPSCVPPSELATAGAAIGVEELRVLRAEPRVLGLGEMMDVEGVIAGRSDVRAKREVFAGRPVDGHCPGLSGPALNAYAAAGVRSDHESTGAPEAREKLRAGLTVFAREASAARDLQALLPLVTSASERRICLCTDDREPSDLLDEGSIDHLVRLALAAGVDPVIVVRLASLNAAEYFGLGDRGAVAPGRRADLVVFSDWADLRPELVWHGGRLVARDGRLLDEPGRPTPAFLDTVRIDWSRVSFAIPAGGRRVRVIEIVADQIVTGQGTAEIPLRNGRAEADPLRDVLKLAVLERHGRTGRLGLGFVRGMGLRSGALASTVAHDHHNLVVVGADDASMETAARAVAAVGGGQAAAHGDTILACLPLPIAGLLSDAPAESVRAGAEALRIAARDLGSGLRSPFSTLSFLALEVVPDLKLTDLGLVDVTQRRLVPLFDA